MKGFVFVLAVVLATGALAGFKPVDVSFARGKWSPEDFTLVKCARHDYIGSFDQLDDCVANHCPPGASPEEVYRKHKKTVYAAMIHRTKFEMGATVSSTMGWDWLMAPLIVIAEDLGKDAQGRPELREHWEVVIFNQGLNVWHHFYENGKQRWFKAASMLLPENAQFKANERYELSVKISRDSRKNKTMTVTAGGYTLQYVDDTLPERFHAGVIGCEGRNFFYDFKVSRGKK